MITRLAILTVNLRNGTFLGLGTDLFVSIPRPGDNEGIFLVFKSSCSLFLLVY